MPKGSERPRETSPLDAGNSYGNGTLVAGGVAEAMAEKPRPGRRPKISGEVEARLIALACETVEEGSGQKGRARWTLRMLAD